MLRTLRSHSQYDVALCVEDHIPELPAARLVFVNAAGWLAGISLEKPFSILRTENESCIGAIAAACFGVAQVFKIALGLPDDRLLRDGVFDVFGLDWTDGWNAGPSPATDIGRLLMVGSGSVGSSAVYCLQLAGVTGEITIVDKDVVKIPEFQPLPHLRPTNVRTQQERGDSSAPIRIRTAGNRAPCLVERLHRTAGSADPPVRRLVPVGQRLRRPFLHAEQCATSDDPRKHYRELGCQSRAPFTRYR